MNLYIMRHGEASRFAVSDSERELTERGREEVSHAAERLRDHSRESGTEILRLITSPYVRARQTAEVTAGVLGQCVIEESSALVPHGDPVSICSGLERADSCVTLLVSHQPLVGRLVSYLTGDELPMGTASVVGIYLEAYAQFCGQLIWTGFDI